MPQYWPRSFKCRRLAPTLAAVVLAHAGLIWLLDWGVLNSRVPVAVDDNIIMASVVTEVAAKAEMPAAPAPATKSNPLPVVPKAPPQNQPTPKTLAQPDTAFVQAPASTSAAPVPFSPAATQATAAPAEVASAAVVASPPASPVAAGVSTMGGARTGNPATAAAAALAPVVLPSSDADYLNNPAPAYPRLSRRMGEQGTVVLRVFINTDGRAEKAEVRTSSGYGRLDEAALDTVQRWRYVPGKRGGVPEAMWFNVPIRFVLD